MEPTRKQSEVIGLAENSTKPIAWFGAVRAGKSVGSVLALLHVMRQRPGDYIVMAFSWGNLERNIVPVLRRALDDDGEEFIERKAHPKTIETEYGKIHFLIASHQGAEKVLQGMTIQGAFTDEILLYPRNVVMQLVGRFSHERPFWIMTANKSDPAHWIKTEWVDEGRVEVVDGLTEDNPHISGDALSWHRALITGAYRDRMLDNEWMSDFNRIASPELLDADREFGRPLDSLLSVWIDPARYHALCWIERLAGPLTAVHAVERMDTLDAVIAATSRAHGRVVANTGPAGEVQGLRRCASYPMAVDRLADFMAKEGDGLSYKYDARDHWREWRSWSYRQSGLSGETKPSEATPSLLAAAHGFMRLSQQGSFAVRERR